MQEPNASPTSYAPTDARSIQKLLLKKYAKEWGRRVLHIWDRGYCGKPWLEEVLAYSLRFVVRWTKHYKLKDAKGEEKAAWKIVLGKRSWEGREKLLLMETLAYAFLLTLLHPLMEAMWSWLLRYFCHRTGKRSQETPAPLYQL